MKKISLLVTVVLMISLSGCKTLQQLNQYVSALEAQKQEVVDNPLPEKNVTDYSDALGSVGRLSTIFDTSAIYIAVEPINNHTAAAGQLPENIQILVESSLNKMSNGHITVIPYNPDAIARYKKKNLFIVHGAITEFDADIRGASGDGSVSLFGSSGNTSADANAEKENSFSVSRISLDFTLQDYASSMYIPGLQVSNKMEITQVTQNHGFGFSIQGNGLSVNAAATIKQGVHSVIRLLVELSMVELLGRYYDIPYWIAIEDSKEMDEKIYEKMRNDFSRATEQDKVRQIQRLLGFINDKPVVPDGRIGRNSRLAIRDFKAAYGLQPVDATIDEQLYEACLRTTCDRVRRTIR